MVHGSLPDMLAFARECAKTENVGNRLGLLVADAHCRIARKVDRTAGLRYLRRSDVRKEIDDAFTKYFEIAPKDCVTKNRYAMHLADAGLDDLAFKMFDEGDSMLKETSLHPVDVMIRARETIVMPRFAKKINEKLRAAAAVRRWDTLQAAAAPPRAKSDDRVLRRVDPLDQGGNASLLRGKRPLVAFQATTIFPTRNSDVENVNVMGRRRPIELPELHPLQATGAPHAQRPRSPASTR